MRAQFFLQRQILLGWLFGISTGLSQPVWETTNFPSFVGRPTAFAVCRDTILVSTNGVFGGGVFRSLDAAVNWTRIDSGLSNRRVNAIVVCGTYLFVGTDGGIFRSTDFGQNWSMVNDGLTNLGISALTVIDTTVFAGTGGGGVFRSRNQGTSWVPASAGIASLNITFLKAVDTLLFVSVGAHFYRSTNYGSYWNRADSTLPDPDVIACLGHEDSLFVGTNFSGVFLTTDGCQTWVPRDSGFGAIFVGVHDFARVADRLFAAWPNPVQGGVYVTTDAGLFWGAMNNGLTDLTVHRLLVFQDYLLAGTIGTGFGNGHVWRRRLGTTRVGDEGWELPKVVTLSQNYPNPFNPTTTIAFLLPRAGHVVLKVYDLLGSEVVTLADENLPPGAHRRTWDARGFACGVYFYTLRSGDRVETRKLLLLR